jgi:multidrug efflux pump subunit AcrA (membrane-fusion protein)
MKLQVSFAVIALAAVGATACSSHESAPAAALPSVAVRTVQVAEADLARPFEAGGVVRARAVASVVARIMAEVRTVLVKPGDRVRAGQPLVQLDARELQAHQNRAEAGFGATQQSAALAEADRLAAEAGLALARLTFDRVSGLRTKNSATQHELDEATAALRGAEARLKVAEARAAEAKAAIASASAGATVAQVTASYATLTAPFDGLVTEKMVDAGNMATPGMPLLTVEDTRGFRLEVRIDESRATFVRAGDAVDVRLDQGSAPGASPADRQTVVRGRVAEVARMLDPGSHAFVVKIDLPDTTGLRSGMFGRATFAGDTHRGLAMPDAALTRRGQLAFAFVVDDTQRARLRLLNVSDAAAGLVEVRSGLVAGERVVVDPPAALVDGSPVTASPAGGENRR